MLSGHNKWWVAVALALGTTVAAADEVSDYAAELASQQKNYHPPRLALVVGNGQYLQLPRRQSLNNPLNDVEVVTARLASLQFDVVPKKNLSTSDMDNAINDLQARVQPYLERGIRPTVVVFFSGHGIDIDGVAHIAGTDFQSERRTATSIPISKIVNQLARHTTLLVFVDACRYVVDAEAPVDLGQPLTFDAQQQQIEGTGSAAPAFDKHSRFSPDVVPKLASYTVLYAVFGSGMLAADGSEASPRNSPYTLALHRRLGVTNADIADDLSAIKRELSRIVRDQEANADGLLTGKFKMKTPPPAETQVEVATRWITALLSDNASEVREYLDATPESPFAYDAARWLSRRNN